MELTQKEKYIIKILKNIILILLHRIDSKNIIRQNLMIEVSCSEKLEWSSVVDHMLGTREVLGSIPSASKGS